MVLAGSIPTVLPAVGTCSKFVLVGHDGSELVLCCTQASDSRSPAQIWQGFLALALPYSYLRPVDWVKHDFAPIH